VQATCHSLSTRNLLKWNGLRTIPELAATTSQSKFQNPDWDCAQILDNFVSNRNCLRRFLIAAAKAVFHRL
jgi:hypothetical protein